MNEDRPGAHKHESTDQPSNMELFRELIQLKEDHPDEVKEIDRLLTSLQKTTVDLKRVLQSFDPEHRRILSVLVSRGIYRAVREVLVEESVDQEL